jgi:hypothetical protein
VVGEPPDVPVVIVKELRSIAPDHRSGIVVGWKAVVLSVRAYASYRLQIASAGASRGVGRRPDFRAAS